MLTYSSLKPLLSHEQWELSSLPEYRTVWKNNSNDNKCYWVFSISSLICILKYKSICKTRTSVSEAKWMISSVDLGLCKTIRAWWLQVKKHKFAWECNFPGLKGFCEKWFYLKIFQLFLCWDISRKMLLNVI